MSLDSQLPLSTQTYIYPSPFISPHNSNFSAEISQQLSLSCFILLIHHHLSLSLSSQLCPTAHLRVHYAFLHQQADPFQSSCQLWCFRVMLQQQREKGLLSSAMVTFAETFQNWTDFPKGLSVLVVDGDNEILHDIKSKLESYGYMVTSFSSGDEACAALASGTQIFHVALVEATANNGVDGYKILEFSKDLPTIMMSAMENMSIMLDLIAVGAVEFLMKPLSEDKLKNIWQHVVRKALDSRDTLQPGYLEPGKSTSMSAAHDHHQTCDLDESNTFEPRNLGQIHHGSPRGSHLLRLSVTHERFPAPLTPQLEQGGRMVLQEATLDESPRSHDSTKVYNHKERVDIESNADKLSSSDTSAKVKAESNERVDIESNADELSSSDTSSKVKTESNETLLILRGIVPVEKEEDDINQEAKIFCCTIPMLESALHSVDADTIQINDMKLLESKFHREDERLAVDGSKCDEAASLQVEICETLLSSTENNEHQSFGKKFALHMDVSEDSVERPNADSVGLSQSSGLDQNRDDGKDGIKKNLNDSEQGGKELKCPNSKKKIKVGWTADLHRRFVQAVEYLGVEQAIPSRILEVMKVDGLTRHNVASHLQKYRSHKKHLSTKEVEASNWNQNRLNYVRPWKHNGNPTWIQPRPPVQPSFQAHHPQLICPPLHVWGHPTVENLGMHVVPQYMASSNTWHTPDGLVWQHPMVDSWIPGMPIGTPCYGPDMKFFATPPGYPQGEAPMFSTWGSTKHTSLEASTEYDLLDLYPSKELLDAVISEALSNPWTPLPLGLKPPSMESVMAELQRQGKNTLSPCT